VVKITAARGGEDKSLQKVPAVKAKWLYLRALIGKKFVMVLAFMGLRG
jgi:hypothetical protein